MRLSMFLGAAAVVTLFAVPASAQFTGVVMPPPAKPSPVVAQSATQSLGERRDSAARVTMTNMKDWVDSAAATLGVAAAPAPAPVDSAQSPVAAVPAAPAVQHPASHSAETTEFREGARAPNTATPVPMLALLGLVSLVAGLWLLRRRRA